MEAVTGADLSFVNLGITIEHLPNSITVFGFRIAFYGIIIGLGMLAGMAIACSDAKRRGQDPDIYLDFALYAIIFSIMGARAYYVIFDWANYKDDLLQIFNLRAGGLAIYGGVIAAALTLIVFTKKRKLSFFSMADSGGADHWPDHWKVGEFLQLRSLWRVYGQPVCHANPEKPGESCHDIPAACGQ